jgi:oligopeptide/dipeptide ABC transporter ATP-binding protein
MGGNNYYPAPFLLHVKGLTTVFKNPQGVLKAVEGVSFVLEPGEVLGIVGESGCGKTVTALSILRLVPNPPGKIVNGKIWFKNQDLLQLPEPEMSRIRGKEIAMVFQDPTAALNPVFRIGEQIAEGLIFHLQMNKREAWREATRLMRLVGIPSPEKRIYEYPHQLSGGMKQRVMLAIALSCRPKLLLADEPTTALDVTVQAQILDLLQKLREDLKTSIILISHDLGIIAEMAQRVLVMYAGQVVEEAPVKTLFQEPAHPYTRGLLAVTQGLGINSKGTSHRLKEIPGSVPAFPNSIMGCKFHPRCPIVHDPCSKYAPKLQEIKEGHWVACWFHYY